MLETRGWYVHMLEVRTLMITYFVSSLMNAVIMAVFWKMERQYHKGLSLYLGLQM